MIDIVSSVQQFAPTLFSIDNSKLMESRRVALEEIDKQNLAAQNAASQLSSVIGALDFHESQQPYKADLINQYDNMVNNALEKYGTLRFAMNDIMAKSRELSTSPEVLGRIKTNEQYKEWEKSIEERKDISQDVKDYTIATNPYKFELKEEVVRDSDGNVVLNADGTEKKKVVGYKDFKGADPVTQYTNEDINKQIMSILSPTTRGSNNITFYTVGADGSYVPTDNFMNALYYIDSTNKMTELTEDKILKAIKQTITDPSIKASLEQDYRVSAYKYKDNDNNPIVLNNHAYYSDGEHLYNSNGIILTEQEYMLERFHELSKTYGYVNKISDKKLQSLISKKDNDESGTKKTSTTDKPAGTIPLDNTVAGQVKVSYQSPTMAQEVKEGKDQTENIFKALAEYQYNDSSTYNPANSRFRQNSLVQVNYEGPMLYNYNYRDTTLNPNRFLNFPDSEKSN